MTLPTLISLLVGDYVMMFLHMQILWFRMLLILFRYFCFRIQETNLSPVMNIFCIMVTKLKEINELGARRIAVYGVPPIGCLPSQRTLAGGPLRNCAQNRNQATQLYNTKLQSKLDLLSQKFPLSKIVYVDVYNPFLHIIQNPQDYGTKLILDFTFFI